jgi:hypothetical protein
MDLTSKQMGPYQINSIIGRGGMAVIYRAVDTRTSEVVALKVMLPHLVHEPETQHRFQKEGENAKRLIHPNIVRVYEAGQLDGHFYIAMEYAAGGTVAGLLKSRSRPMSVTETLPILYRVAAALDYAHHRGILHRDVKLSNILIGRNNQILLSDFGIARRIGSDHTMVTTTGYAVGTPAYMSPEQARGDKTIDHRADIYSFGVVAYVMLTQAMPFEADTPLVLLRKVIDLAPTPPEKANPHVLPGVSYVLQRVLAKNPEQRYASATEFVTALEAGVTQTPTAQEWSALTQPAGESPTIPVRPSAPAKTIPAKPDVRTVAPPPPQRTRRGWPLVIGGVIGVLLLWGILQNWAGGLPTLRRADGQLAATSAATVTTETMTAAGATSTAVAVPIVLSNYVDTDWGFSIDIPKQWSKSRQGTTLYFEAPDHLAWAFVERLPTIGNTANAAQVLNDYLASDKTPFHSYQADSNVAGTINSFEIHEQHFQATLLGGAQFTGRIVAIIKGQHAFIYGVSLAPQAQGNLTDVAAIIIDSFAITPQAVAVVVATASSTPTPQHTDTPTATPTTGGTSTRTLAQSLTRIIAAPEVIGTRIGSVLAIVKPNKSTATATRMPTHTPTETPVTILMPKLLPTSTPIPDPPTVTPTIVPTATPTQIIAPTATIVQTRNSNTNIAPEVIISLLTPSDGDTFDARLTFSWAANSLLPEGYGFEPVFWRTGEDPLRDGRGYGGTTTTTSLGISADVFTTVGEGEFYWGLLLVKTSAYERIQFLGERRTIHVKFSSGSNTSSSDSPPPSDGGNRED